MEFKTLYSIKPNNYNNLFSISSDKNRNIIFRNNFTSDIYKKSYNSFFYISKIHDKDYYNTNYNFYKTDMIPFPKFPKMKKIQKFNKKKLLRKKRKKNIFSIKYLELMKDINNESKLKTYYFLNNNKKFKDDDKKLVKIIIENNIEDLKKDINDLNNIKNKISNNNSNNNIIKELYNENKKKISSHNIFLKEILNNINRKIELYSKENKEDDIIFVKNLLINEINNLYKNFHQIKKEIKLLIKGNFIKKISYKEPSKIFALSSSSSSSIEKSQRISKHKYMQIFLKNEKSMGKAKNFKLKYDSTSSSNWTKINNVLSLSQTIISTKEKNDNTNLKMTIKKSINKNKPSELIKEISNKIEKRYGHKVKKNDRISQNFYYPLNYNRYNSLNNSIKKLQDKITNTEIIENTKILFNKQKTKNFTINNPINNINYINKNIKKNILFPQLKKTENINNQRQLIFTNIINKNNEEKIEEYKNSNKIGFLNKNNNNINEILIDKKNSNQNIEDEVKIINEKNNIKEEQKKEIIKEKKEEKEEKEENKEEKKEEIIKEQKEEKKEEQKEEIKDEPKFDSNYSIKKLLEEIQKNQLIKKKIHKKSVFKIDKVIDKKKIINKNENKNDKIKENEEIKKGNEEEKIDNIIIIETPDSNNINKINENIKLASKEILKEKILEEAKILRKEILQPKILSVPKKNDKTKKNIVNKKEFKDLKNKISIINNIQEMNFNEEEKEILLNNIFKYKILLNKIPKSKEEIEKEEEIKQKLKEIIEKYIYELQISELVNTKSIFSKKKNSLKKKINFLKNLNILEEEKLNEINKQIINKKLSDENKEKNEVHKIDDENERKRRAKDKSLSKKKKPEKLIYDNSYMFKKNKKKKVIKEEVKKIINTNYALTYENKSVNDSFNSNQSLYSFSSFKSKKITSKYKVKNNKNISRRNSVFSSCGDNFKSRFIEIINEEELLKKEESERKKRKEIEEQRKREELYDKRLYDFFEKIKKLKNNEENQDELEKLIDERFNNTDNSKEIRINDFIHKLELERDKEKFNNKFQNKRLGYSSPLIFTMNNFYSNNKNKEKENKYNRTMYK